MKHIIAILICFIVLVGTVVFQVIDVIGTQDIVSGYTNVVEFFGRSQLTSKMHLIGERYDEQDDYTGGYKCNADNVTGKDVIYGGCTTKGKIIRLKGKINTDAGKVNISIRYGSESADISADENGFIDKKLDFDGGGNYIIVQYKDFTGNIDIRTEYV